MDSNKFISQNIKEAKSEDIKPAINSLKESKAYLRAIFKKNNLKITITALKINSTITYTFKLFGRYYMEDFSSEKSYADITDSLLAKINKLASEYVVENSSLDRKTRRFYIKSKKARFENWVNAIKSNISKGLDSQARFLAAQVKKNSLFLVDRELNYRHLLAKLNYDGSEIEAKVDNWYDAAIKDNSFMTDK